MGSIIETIGLATGAGKTKAPKRNIGTEVGDILGQGGKLLESQQQLTPGYTDLKLSTLNDTLMGARGQEGLLSLYQNKLLPGLTEAQNTAASSVRNANLGDLGKYGASTVQALKDMDPAQAKLYELLTRDATAGLAAGNRLTSDETYNAVNPVRSDWARRGLGTSAPGQLDESLQLFAGGNALGQQRRDNATRTATLGSSLYSTPALTALFSGSAPTGQAQAFLGGGQTSSSPFDVFGQLGGYASQMYGQNASNKMQSNLNNAQQEMKMWSSAGDSFNSLVGGLGMMCWSAREIFGVWDGRWLEFRHWMLLLSPDRLFAWYAAHGERWAERLRTASPGTRAAVQRWMERRMMNHA